MEYNKEKNSVYSEKVRAGRRTYFFDARATRNNDYYITITERRVSFNGDNEVAQEKHKLFLYKEDFNKFVQALNKTVTHVKEQLLPEYDFTQFDNKFERGQVNQ